MPRPTLFSNRKFMKLAQRLQSDALALGHLEFIWHAANESGNPVLGDADDVEALARWRGGRGELVAALMECGTAGGGSGLLDLRSDGLYEIHDYWHHAPGYVSNRRGREAERTREKVCQGCGGPYFSSDSRAEYCSSACRSRAYRARQTDTESSRIVTDRHGSSRTENGTVTDSDGTEREARTANDGSSQKVTDRHSTPYSQHPTPNTKEKIYVDNKTESKSKKPKPNGIDPDLEQAILAAYHEILSDLPSIREWNDRRKKKLRARIQERLRQGKNDAATADYWQRLFAKVERSDFLMGRTTNWRCPGLEWLLEPKNFLKLIEGGFDNAGSGHG